MRRTEDILQFICYSTGNYGCFLNSSARWIIRDLFIFYFFNYAYAPLQRIIYQLFVNLIVQRSDKEICNIEVPNPISK